MIMKVIVGDNVFVTKNDETQTVEEISEAIYENINKVDKFKLETEDGRIVIFGEKMIEKSIFIFLKQD